MFGRRRSAKGGRPKGPVQSASSGLDFWTVRRGHAVYLVGNAGLGERFGLFAALAMGLIQRSRIRRDCAPSTRRDYHGPKPPHRLAQRRHRHQRRHPDRRRGVRRRLRRLLGARHAVRSRRPRRSASSTDCSCSAASPSWRSSSATRTASSRSPRATERARRALLKELVKKVFARGELILLHRAKNLLFPLCPISHVPVAVCRSVGSGTRGPPAAWREKPKLSKKSDRQPEAKPANPALSRGRGLKQRRSGFFGLCRPPPPARVTEEACSSLPAVRTGSPLPIQGSLSGQERSACASPSRAAS